MTEFRCLPPLLELKTGTNGKFDAPILHRDLSDGNILVRKGLTGHDSFCLLDTNRIRVRRKLGGFRRAKNLIRLGIPPASQKYFLSCYWGGGTPRRAHWVWYRLNKNVFASYLKVKKKLRLRRIARFLRIQ